jgi:hypothetical protein
MVRFVRCLLAISTVALAQTATVTGIITDPDGGVVKDAPVRSKTPRRLLSRAQ